MVSRPWWVSVGVRVTDLSAQCNAAYSALASPSTRPATATSQVRCATASRFHEDRLPSHYPACPLVALRRPFPEIIHPRRCTGTMAQPTQRHDVRPTSFPHPVRRDVGEVSNSTKTAHPIAPIGMGCSVFESYTGGHASRFSFLKNFRRMNPFNIVHILPIMAPPPRFIDCRYMAHSAHGIGVATATPVLGASLKNTCQNRHCGRKFRYEGSSTRGLPSCADRPSAFAAGSSRRSRHCFQAWSVICATRSRAERAT